MHDGNPGEIDFGSSYHEIQVSEGSSYRESTVIIQGNFFSCQYDSTIILFCARMKYSASMTQKCGLDWTLCKS